MEIQHIILTTKMSDRNKATTTMTTNHHEGSIFPLKKPLDLRFRSTIVPFCCIILAMILRFIPNNSNRGISHYCVSATSINYGISQQPITDISQLMPKLCQNQSVICEGSYCIPNVRKCVCDLRMPVQFGRFCLRQVDIETKCFVTNQCNHTIKDALCIDINSNAILDAESSKFKLEQWQQLNELRQMSQSTLSKDVPKQQQSQIVTFTTTTESPQRQMFLFDSNPDSLSFEARDDVIMSNARNSPYEINYNTPELLLQNHTRRKTNSDRSTPFPFNLVTSSSFHTNKDAPTDEKGLLANTITSDVTMPATMTVTPTTTVAATTTTATPTPDGITTTTSSQTTIRSVNMETHRTTTPNVLPDSGSSQTDPSSTKDPTASTISYDDLANRKKMIVKSPNWPPGICSCPFGFMFDSMLRKCLALSLADSHCQVDTDCKQIAMAHCSTGSKKCECDEPLVWNQTELACVRPKPLLSTESQNSKKEMGGFVDNLLPPLILAKLLPDHTVLLLIFVILVIIGTLIILKLAVKCFSSSSSALISPKNKKKKKAATNSLPPRSPYATLRRPDHKPSLSNFSQATRGRILNYDFEQECTKDDIGSFKSHLEPESGAGQKKSRPINDKVNTMRPSSKNYQKHNHQQLDSTLPRSFKPNVEEASDQLMELNDNISVSQLESESKSDNSILTIPAPPPNQQPPYMLASAMKGQGSAIAAAAAAVANKRMQMAQKKNLEQQSGTKLPNGSPVFL